MSSGAIRLKVLSFNILAEQFIDYSDLSVDYPGIPVDVLKEKNRLPKMFAYLKSVNADLMLLQEVNPKVLAMIEAKFSDEYFIYPLATHRGDEPVARKDLYGNLTLFRKSVGQKGVQTVYRVPKLGTAFALADTVVCGNKTLFVNIHLDSDKEETKRRLEIKHLIKLLDKYPEHSIIMSGDFNTSNATTHKSFAKFKPAVKEPVGSYLNDDPMIDWIYVKNVILVSGKVLKPARANSATPLKKFGSDHYPVVANICMPCWEI